MGNPFVLTDCAQHSRSPCRLARGRGAELLLERVGLGLEPGLVCSEQGQKATAGSGQFPVTRGTSTAREKLQVLSLWQVSAQQIAQYWGKSQN